MCAIRQVIAAQRLHEGDDIAPIPGTKRVARVEENTAADHIALSADQTERLDTLTPAAGERHDEGNMGVIENLRQTRHLLLATDEPIPPMDSGTLATRADWLIHAA